MRHGVKGLTKGDLIDLTDTDQDRLDRLAMTPSAGLGSTRGTVAHVIARDGATADALATALSVLEPAGARELLARVPAILVSLTRADPAGIPSARVGAVDNRAAWPFQKP